MSLVEAEDVSHKAYVSELIKQVDFHNSTRSPSGLQPNTVPKSFIILDDPNKVSIDSARDENNLMHKRSASRKKWEKPRQSLLKLPKSTPQQDNNENNKSWRSDSQKSGSGSDSGIVKTI